MAEERRATYKHRSLTRYNYWEKYKYEDIIALIGDNFVTVLAFLKHKRDRPLICVDCNLYVDYCFCKNYGFQLKYGKYVSREEEWPKQLREDDFDWLSRLFFNHWGRIADHAKEYLISKGVRPAEYNTKQRQYLFHKVKNENLLKFTAILITDLIKDFNIEVAFIDSLPSAGKSTTFKFLDEYRKGNLVIVHEHPLVRSWLDADDEYPGRSAKISDIHHENITNTFKNKPGNSIMLVERDMRAAWTFSGEYDERPNVKLINLIPEISLVNNMYIYLSVPMRVIWDRISNVKFRSYEKSVGLDYHKMTECKLEEKWCFCNDYNKMVRIDLSPQGDYTYIIVMIEDGSDTQQKALETTNRRIFHSKQEFKMDGEILLDEVSPLITNIDE